MRPRASPSGRFVLGRWWESFRLVLLLAIGPALVALALATAHKPPRYEPQFTKNAAGVQVVTSYVLVKADVPYAGEVRLGQRLMIAGVLIVTILVHGGAAISVGLGLATVNGGRDVTLAAAVGLTVLVVLVLPIYLFLLNQGSRSGHRHVELRHGLGFAARSARHPHLVQRRRDPLVRGLSGTLSLHFSPSGFPCWTIWVWQHRLSGVSKAKPSLATDFHGGQAAVGVSRFSPSFSPMGSCRTGRRQVFRPSRSLIVLALRERGVSQQSVAAGINHSGGLLLRDAFARALSLARRVWVGDDIANAFLVFVARRCGSLPGGTPMPLHFGPGPVFIHESIAASRRWQMYALRSVFVLGLLLALALVLYVLIVMVGQQAGSSSIRGWPASARDSTTPSRRCNLFSSCWSRRRRPRVRSASIGSAER